MNGGALGAYTWYHPWGDTFAASAFGGEGAALLGSESIGYNLSAMAASPEPFTWGETSNAIAAARGGETPAMTDCKSGCCRRFPLTCCLPFIKCKCVQECEATGEHGCGPFGAIPAYLCKPASVAALSIGIGLVLIGALAITRG